MDGPYPAIMATANSFTDEIAGRDESVPDGLLSRARTTGPGSRRRFGEVSVAGVRAGDDHGARPVPVEEGRRGTEDRTRPPSDGE